MRVINSGEFFTFAFICIFSILSCKIADGGYTNNGKTARPQSTLVSQTDRAALPGTVSDRRPWGSWSIIYGVTGGFAGIKRQLELESTGKVTVNDFKQKRTVRKEASREQMTNISTALSKIDFPETQRPQSGRSSNCRDCFEYTIIIFNDGRQYKLHYNDLSLRSSPCAGIAALLSAMMNHTLAKPEP